MSHIILTKEDYQTFIEEGLIRSYPSSLLANLRKKEAYGLPLSVLLLSHPCCTGQCYPMSVFLSCGMERFKIVHGNVNCISRNNEYPNHSWVENNGYVYDTTDGFMWDKALYYMLFEPEVIETLDQDKCKQDTYYQEVLENSKKNVSKDMKGLLLQYLEVLEEEHPTVNHHLLLDEIKTVRQQENLKTYSDEIMKQYKKRMCEDERK